MRRAVAAPGQRTEVLPRSSSCSLHVLPPLKSEDKLDPEEQALVERMKRFAASIKDQQAALSF